VTSEARLLVEGDAPPKLGRPFTIVGTNVNRIDGLEKATGKARYSGDMKISGLLHAKILRSPHAHAKIVKVDTSEAENLPGVRAVISINNCAGWYTSWYSIRQPAFVDEVGCYGQEIAAVAADSVEIAEKAIKLVRVEYQTLPAVFEPEDAMKPGAPSVPSIDQVDESVSRSPHAKPVNNIFEGKPSILKRGNVETGFREADVTIERTFETSAQFHAALQTRCCIAHWDGQSLTVYDSAQGPWQVKEDLARSLNLDPERVRVVIKYMGGGFGSKAGALRSVHYASKLSMLAHKPVRLELTRPEEFIAHPHRQASKTWIEIGAKRDGKLCAIREKIVLNLGIGSAYGGQGPRGIEHAFELYDCPNAYCEQWAVHTNTPLTGYMRSVMRVMGNFPLESAIDDLAIELGMDPVELRMKNYAIYANQSSKKRYSQKNLDKCIAKVTEASGWKEKRNRYATENRTNASPIKKGIGIATYIYGGTGQRPFKAKATVELARDGKATVYVGFADIGGGQATMAAMLVAEELGLRLDDVTVHWGDTDHTDYAPGTHASRLTAEMGPALVQAAHLARMLVFEKAALKLGTRPEELESALGKIYSKSNPTRSISFQEACSGMLKDEKIVAKGSRASNPDDPAFKTFGAQVAEVEVDTETGGVRVIRITSAHELGRALNPKLCYSQQYGAITMGLGFALYEAPAMDSKTGIMLNTDLHQYGLVSSTEEPEIVAFNIEAEDPYFAYSAKAVGEAPLVPVAAAVRNAIAHACGAKLYSTPMSRWKIIEGIEKSEGENIALRAT
jgi:CO/xanthine dehydrogenase Mo-binding subunit